MPAPVYMFRACSFISIIFALGVLIPRSSHSHSTPVLRGKERKEDARQADDAAFRDSAHSNLLLGYSSYMSQEEILLQLVRLFNLSLLALSQNTTR